MFESSVWNNKLADWWNGVLIHFCPLAIEAFSCPSTDVLSDGRPNELVADGFARPGNSRVAQTMN